MLTLLSFNIGNFDEEAIRELAYFLRDANPDIIGLYEVAWAHNTNAVSLIKEILGLPYSLVSTSLVTHNHTLLLSRYPIEAAQTIDSFVNSGIIATVATPSLSFTLAAVHLAPSPEQKRLNEISKVLESIDYTHTPTIIMGDFNAIAENDPVEYTGTPESPVQYETTSLMTSTGFLDTAKVKGQAFIPTVPVTQDGGVVYRNLRLDYIYINSLLSQYAYEYSVLTPSAAPNLSDHQPITLSLNI